MVFYKTFFGVEPPLFSQSPKVVFSTNCAFPLNTLWSYNFRSRKIYNEKISEIVALHFCLKRTTALMYVWYLLLILRQPRMQVKFERLNFLTNTLIKFRRKIWDPTECVIKIILTRKLWENLQQYHFQPKMTKGELVHEVKGAKVWIIKYIHIYWFLDLSTILIITFWHRTLHA